MEDNWELQQERELRSWMAGGRIYTPDLIYEWNMFLLTREKGGREEEKENENDGGCWKLR